MRSAARTPLIPHLRSQRFKHVVRSIINIKAAGRVHRAMHQPCVSSMLDELIKLPLSHTERSIPANLQTSALHVRWCTAASLRATNEEQTGRASPAKLILLMLRACTDLHLCVCGGGGGPCRWMYAHANMLLYYFVWVPRWFRRGYVV